MPEDSDDAIERLIDQANRGDKEAWGRLLDLACDRLHKLTRTMLAGFPSVRRWEQTDDVFVNAMMRLHRSLEKVQPESPRHFFNFAATQIRRELLDLKKHYYGPLGIGKNHHTDHQPPDQIGGMLAEERHNPEELDRWEAFHAAVELLPDDLREVFNLIYYQGLPQERVASILGVGLSTVKRRWQDAKLRLHDELDESS
jgi:RNA polymerase sigma-70 factor (ECF subfamily)